MRKRLRTEDEALWELQEAVRWYDPRPGLGAQFLAAVDATLNQVVRLPQAGAPVPRIPTDLPVRRAPVKQFPYHVVYLETYDSIRILAFAHDSRRPGSIRVRPRKPVDVLTHQKCRRRVFRQD